MSAHCIEKIGVGIKIDNPREGTETFASSLFFILPLLIKIDNPREGTETRMEKLKQGTKTLK